MENVQVGIKKSKGFEDLPLPAYATEGACAVDLHAAIDDNFLWVHPGDRTIVSAGISIAIPRGYEASIRPRSGLAWKKGLSIINSPGTIDSDYRGVVGVIVINLGQEKIKIERGERIAQMLVQPVTRIQWDERELDETVRGTGGFGSTDKDPMDIISDESQSSTLQDAHDKENGAGEESTHEGPRGDEHLNRGDAVNVKETTQTSAGEAPVDTTKMVTEEENADLENTD